MMQFKEFNFYLKLATDYLTAEEHRLALEKAAFGRILAEVKEFNDDQTPEPLVMDVGGKPFHTHTKTLHHGMLAAMVSDDFPKSDWTAVPAPKLAGLIPSCVMTIIPF